MEFDFEEGSSLTPPFEVTYNCLYEGKKIVLASDLNAGSDESVVDSLTLTCQDNGTYDKEIEDYLCTRVCPHPSNPDPDFITVDHNSTTDPKPEIYDTVTFSCKDEGKKLVSKNAFRTGAPTTFLDDLMSMCLITGWLNETIGSYTCTRDCETPVNYTEVFNYDFTADSTTLIGDTYNYECLDSRKKVVNLQEENSDLLDILNITCIYNGEWSANPTDYGCTECLRKYDPPNGKFICESKRYALDSKCLLKCDPGYIPYDQVSTTCLFSQKTEDFEWSIEDDRLRCVRAIAFIIGGIQSNYEYTNEVEIFSPGVDCLSQPPNYPHPIVGTSSGFSRGQNIVCGGGRMEYAECSKHYEGSWDCNTDLDCVVTKGGARWCTGPKTKKCYSLIYDPVANKEVV